MNTDKLTTFLGLIVAAGVTFGIWSQEQSTVLRKLIESVLPLAIALWGIFTNKE
jgi:hypothetical protein